MSTTPPIEILPEHARHNPEALQAYLQLSDFAEEDGTRKKQEKQNRLTQAMSFANDHRENRENRLSVARTALDHMKMEKERQKAEGSVQEMAKQSSLAEEIIAELERQEGSADEIADTWAVHLAEVLPGTDGMSEEQKRELGHKYSLGLLSFGAKIFKFFSDTFSRVRTSFARRGIFSGVGAGALAVAGAGGMKDFMKIAKEVEDALEKGESKLKDLLDGATEKFDDVVEKIERAKRLLKGGSVTGKEAEKMQKRLKALEEELDRFKNENTADDGTKVEQATEFVSGKFVQAVMPTQFDVAQAVKVDTPEVVMRGVEEIFTLAKRNKQSVSMSDFLACMNALGPKKEVTDQEPFDALLRKLYGGNEAQGWSKENRARKRVDLHFLVVFLVKHRTTLADNAKFAGKNLAELPLGEAMSAYARVSQNLGELGHKLKKAAIEGILERKIPDINFDELFSRDLYTQAAFRKLFFEYSGHDDYERLSKSDLEAFNRNADLVMEQLITSSIRLKLIPKNATVVSNAIPDQWKDGNRIRPEYQGAYDVLVNFANDVRSGSSKEEILRLLMIHEDPKQRSPDEKKIVELFDRLFEDGELKLSDALQMRILDQSGAAGNVMSLFKALSILKEYAPANSNLDNNRWVNAINEIIGSVDSSEAIDRLKLSPEAQTEVVNLGKYISIEFWQKLYSMWQSYGELWEINPKAAALVSAAALGKASGIVIPTVISLSYLKSMYDWNRISTFIKQGPQALVAKYGSEGMTLGRAEAFIDKLKDLSDDFDSLRKNGLFKYWDRRKIRFDALKYMKNSTTMNVPPPIPKKATAPSPPPVSPPRSAGAMAASQEAADITRAGTEVDEIKLANVLKQFDHVTSANVDAFLRVAAEGGAIRLDADTLTMISESPGARSILAGAIEAADETQELTELNRALKAARGARNIRAGLNVAGAAGDVFAVCIAVADLVENRGRIEDAKKTNNQALADLYSRADYMYAAEAAEGIAGLTVGGIAVYTTAASGTSFLTALSASGGLMMLPVSAAVLGVGSVNRLTERASEIWLRNAEDWARALSPGELLEKLKELAPGREEQGYFSGQGYGKGTIGEQIIRLQLASKGITSFEEYAKWEFEGFKTIEQANAKARYEVTKAYVIRTTLLPKIDGESDAEYQKRFNLNVIDQMEYITARSHGGYQYLSGDSYSFARIHAELMERARELQRKKGSEIMRWVDDGEEHEFDLVQYGYLKMHAGPGEYLDQQSLVARYRERAIDQKLLQFSMMHHIPGMEEVQQKQSVASQLLMDVRDELLRLDGRMASADFRGILGQENVGEERARYAASKVIQNTLKEQTNVLLGKVSDPMGVTRSDYENALRALKASAGKDPLEYQTIFDYEYYNPRKIVSVGSKEMLSLPYLLERIQSMQ